jgi:hypothetical protein
VTLDQAIHWPVEIPSYCGQASLGFPAPAGKELR